MFRAAVRILLLINCCSYVLAESVWVLGSYAHKPNALAEQVRIADLLGTEVFLRFSDGTQTWRVITPRHNVTFETLTASELENWRLELDPEHEPFELRNDTAPSKAVFLGELSGAAGQGRQLYESTSAPAQAEYLRELTSASTPAPIPTPIPTPKVTPLPAAPLPARTAASALTSTVVVSSDPTKDTTPKRKRSSFVPPGFEDLVAPQTTLVDVYYGGLFVTSATATFTPTYITFLNPTDIVARIPDVLDPATIERVLLTEMPTNNAFACTASSQSDCGKVDTEAADVIFDESRFRADLFVAPELLSVRPAGVDKFLPASSSGLSLLNVTSAAFNGQQSLGNNYNVGNSTTLAYKETRLFAVSNITKTDDLTFDTIALQREINGQLTQAGFFRSTPGTMTFLGQQDFAGISIASSLNTRTDLDQSAGNDLQVFLDTRSRVDIFKDGRLISTATYDTGNQILDTSQLPGGAYDIQLVIRDNFGGFREETRFYVKTNQLPPKDQALYFFDAGEKVTKVPGEILPETTGESFVRAGISKRLTDSFGGELGMSSTESDQVLETGLFRLGRFYDLQMNYAFGSDEAQGAGINARTRLGRLTFNIAARRVWAEDATTSSLGPELAQTSLNLTIPFGRSTLNLTSRYNRRATSTDENYGLRFDFPTFNFGSRTLDSNFQVTRNNDDTLVLLGVRLSHRGGHWYNQVSGQYFEEQREGFPDENGLIGNVSTSWQDGDRYLSDLSVTMRGVQERDDRSYESEVDYLSDLGRANVEVVYSEESERYSYGASFFTSIIANDDTFALGGRQQAQSALVLNIEGDLPDAYFDVLVNGSPKGSAQIGKKTIVGLAPYDIYKVGLQPRGKSLIEFNNSIKTATLYPGNVVTMNWKVTRALVAFGQINDASGNPITNAVIEGVLGLATTDDFGFFQAEIEADTERFSVRTRQIQCEVTIPAFDATELIVMLNELTCL